MELTALLAALASLLAAGAIAWRARRMASGCKALAGQLERERLDAEAVRLRLEDALRARTSELQSAQAALDAVDARRRQFLEDVSHELRTPATAIRGEAEIVLRGPDRPAQDYKLALQRVITIVQQMALLIDDVLLLARVEAEQQALRRVALPWVEVLRETARSAAALGHEQTIRIVFEPAAEGPAAPDDPLLAHADPDRLRQALMVVLDNAVRYSRPHGAVRIGWCAEADWLCAIVRDEGIGIDAAELPSLFMRYARGARARAHRADGSGLGLPIAKAIVQAHGGRIGIESVPDAGTTVRISVPRWRGAQAEG